MFEGCRDRRQQRDDRDVRPLHDHVPPQPGLDPPVPQLRGGLPLPVGQQQPGGDQAQADHAADTELALRSESGGSINISLSLSLSL